MFKPNIGDVLFCGDRLYIIIMDADKKEDRYTWRFLPVGMEQREDYTTSGRYFQSHVTTHTGLSSYALICNIFDDIDWGEIHAKTKSA